VIIGISTDPVNLQKQFVEKERLNYPLLSDSDKSISKRFGVLNEKGGYANRATFVIDKTGTIAQAYPNVKDVNKHPEEVLKFVEERLGKNQ
jgi:peroxiredoxin